MKAIAVSQDRETLMQVVECLEEVFTEIDVVPCFDLVTAGKLCDRSGEEIGLVICSVEMQKLTKFELMKQIKRMQKLIPVFMYISTNDMNLKMNAVRNGASACITLPFTTDKVRQAADLYFASCEWQSHSEICGQSCIREWCRKWNTEVRKEFI